MPVLSLAEGVAGELYRERRAPDRHPKRRASWKSLQEAAVYNRRSGRFKIALPGKTNLHFTENISNGGPGSLSNQTG